MRSFEETVGMGAGGGRMFGDGAVLEASVDILVERSREWFFN